MTATVTSLSSRYAALTNELGRMTAAEQTREIIREVAQSFGLDVPALLGHRRTRPFAVARMAAYAEVHARRPHLSLVQLGRAFGGRHHTTILIGIRTYHARMAWAECLIAAGEGAYQPETLARAA